MNVEQCTIHNYSLSLCRSFKGCRGRNPYTTPSNGCNRRGRRPRRLFMLISCPIQISILSRFLQKVSLSRHEACRLSTSPSKSQSDFATFSSGNGNPLVTFVTLPLTGGIPFQARLFPSTKQPPPSGEGTNFAFCTLHFAFPKPLSTNAMHLPLSPKGDSSYRFPFQGEPLENGFECRVRNLVFLPTHLAGYIFKICSFKIG